MHFAALAGRIVFLLSIGILCASCTAPTSESGSGAAETAKVFCESIQQEDWGQAYAALDGPSRKGCTAEKFTRLAADYRKNMGFEPREVFVRFCEEHGDQALAHVVFTGAGPAGEKFYKAVVTLRQNGSSWSVVLSARFGRTAH